MPAISSCATSGSSWITRVVRLAFLSPEIVDAVLAGTIPAHVDGLQLTQGEGIAGCWERQRLRYL
ncbi:hypothetical protein M9978_13905 [Sphingomonas sp. MG17]|uniref:Uncharacterized protein n=1 Tax=Sphingomonas tagetis TaxID=2949092 RepID=A0A9X2KQ86_9SPHN|nr:hypothetical protein [Sphingomonas tagetis]MCP3731518.1 hypothetical protein [Sphingomonas tagetis]